MSGRRNINAKTKAKAKGGNGPIRVVLRCAWSGARLAVPTSDDYGGPVTPSTTLGQIASRLRSNLPTAAFQAGGGGATMVCLRKTVPCSEWDTTTLRTMLDGDDGAAGVILTLDIGSGRGGECGVISVSPPAAVVEAAAGCNGGGTSSGTDPIVSAARSLNIKLVDAPPEPMDVSPSATDIGVPEASMTPNPNPETAWSNVLRSNFDATTKDCLLTLLKIIDNLLSKPADPKVRSIRCTNAAFDRKVGRVAGAFEFMHSFGFSPVYPVLGGTRPETLELRPANESRDTLVQAREVLVSSAVADLGIDGRDIPLPPKDPSPSAFPPLPSGSSAANTKRGTSSSTSTEVPGDFNVYKAHSYNVQSAAVGAPNPYVDASSVSVTEWKLQQLEAKKDRMEREMQSNMEMDRGLVAYLPGNSPETNSNTGNTAAAAAAAGRVGERENRGDSTLVAARMKRMEEERKKREEGGFTTKAMRDLDKMKKAKVYSHAQIRISFADGASLYAKFLPGERVSSVRSVIRSAFIPSMRDALAFDLYVAPPRRMLDESKRLDEEGLVPAAKIFVSWKWGVSPPPPPVEGFAGGYLIRELFGAGSVGGASVSEFPAAKNLVGGNKEKSKAAAEGKDNGSGAAAKGKAPSKEEVMMKRMMGKSAGLFGTGSSTPKKRETGKGGGGTGSGGSKPNWFKG